MSKPQINVTPLIDVLLVLLIIFMVVAPLRPSSFRARIPSEPSGPHVETGPETLVVMIADDLSLSLNNESDLGTIEEPGRLTERLRLVFSERFANGAFDASGAIPRAVFIRAPRRIAYGNVARAIDAVKLAGAEPIALQIDLLD